MCDCDRVECRHHHAFGGTYPCEGQSCPRCRPREDRMYDAGGDWARGLSQSIGIIDEATTWVDPS